MPRGAAFARSADEVLALAVQLGTQWNLRRGSVHAPICVVVNETTTFEGSGSTHVGIDLGRAIAQRRHLGLEFIACMQHAAQLPASVFEFATEVHMFRQKRVERVVTLEKTLGENPGALAGLADLPKHRFGSWRPDDGLF
jgi:hypothetical protein